MALAPVFQLSKTMPNGGVDYDYVLGLPTAQAQEASGYTIDCVAFVGQDAPGNNLLELKRYVHDGFHYFTTQPGAEVNGWNYVPLPTKAYLLPTTQAQPDGMVQLHNYVRIVGGEWIHFMSADLATNPVPPGYTPYSAAHTGWCKAPTRVEFTVNYNGNGNENGSGVTITGGNATGEKVTLYGAEYTMTPADAYVQFGIGNWIAFNKADAVDTWHIQDLNESSNSDVRFRKVTFSGDQRIAVIDDDNDAGNTDEGYKYTLSLFDVTNDKVIVFDPKIVNRGAISPGPH